MVQLKCAGCGEITELPAMRAEMGGSYAYALGHLVSGAYRDTQNLYRTNYPIMADAPSSDLPDPNDPLERLYGRKSLAFDKGMPIPDKKEGEEGGPAEPPVTARERR